MAGLIPFGVDVDDSKLEHARLLQPQFAMNFLAGNMFERVPLDADTVYSLIILMPGRLLEVDEALAERLREWLRGHFKSLLVYAYGEWLTRYNGLPGWPSAPDCRSSRSATAEQRHWRESRDERQPDRTRLEERMSDDARRDDTPKGDDDDLDLARRQRDFTRRALIRAGWVVPMVTTVNVRAAAAQSPGPHNDVHGDVPHVDEITHPC